MQDGYVSFPVLISFFKIFSSCISHPAGADSWLDIFLCMRVHRESILQAFFLPSNFISLKYFLKVKFLPFPCIIPDITIQFCILCLEVMYQLGRPGWRTMLTRQKLEHRKAEEQWRSSLKILNCTTKSVQCLQVQGLGHSFDLQWVLRPKSGNENTGRTS